MLHRNKSFPLLALFALVTISCTGTPGRVKQPKYATDAGSSALAAYDTNRDGVLADAEFDQVPALRSALESIDLDGDMRLTASEIDARVQTWRDSRVAEMNVRCEVTLDGKPLEGGQVFFEPEPFLGSQLKPASGTSGEDGTAGISLAAEHLADARYPGMACGWYKIRVTHASQQLPARYNTATMLGCEVAPNAGWQVEGAVKLELKSSP